MTRILVVEDEYVIAANLQENLETLGYGVIDIASSGLEAVEKALILNPDLVLMDIRLQGDMDGIQAAQHIWEQRHIPVIYITGHSDNNTVKSALATSPFGYILKPVRGNELYVAIETALTRYEREHLLTTVLQTIGEGIIVANAVGRILFLNRAAEQLTGWQHHEVNGRELKEIFKGMYNDTFFPRDTPTLITALSEPTGSLDGKLLLITKQGKTLPISSSIAPIQNSKGQVTGAVLMFQDNTQARLKEEYNLAIRRAKNLQHQTNELAQLSRLKDEFLAQVSEELKSPLENIKAAIQILEDTLKRDLSAEPESLYFNPSLKGHIETMQDERQQTLRLASNLSKLQRAETTEPVLKWKPIRLNEWFLRNIPAFEKQAQKRNQHLQVFVSPDLPVVLSDQSILTQIFIELLTNACKHTPEYGTITVSIEVEKKAEFNQSKPQHSPSPNYLNSHRIQLRVCNSGAKIPAERLAHLFDTFYQIGNRDRSSQIGAGIGLALVKKWVTALDGSIEVTSSTEETCFTVELPTSRPTDDNA